MRHNFKLYCKDYENIENYKKAKECPPGFVPGRLRK